MAYDQKTWNSIKREWLAGQLSVSDMSRSYGPTRGAIQKRAKKEAWPSRGTLIEEVRKEIDTQLVIENGKSGSKSGTPDSDDIIARAAMRGAEVIRLHRGLIGRLLGQAEVTLSELEELERIRLEMLTKGRVKSRKLLIKTIIQNRVDGMEAVARVLKSVLPLDRQAFSLDSERGGVAQITYNTPKINKPKGSGLSEDEWDNDD